MLRECRECGRAVTVDEYVTQVVRANKDKTTARRLAICHCTGCDKVYIVKDWEKEGLYIDAKI